MRKPIGYWLKELDRLLDLTFDQLLGARALSRRHWQVLETLSAGPVTRTRLDEAVAPFLTADAPTVAPVIDDLVARGWAYTGGAGVALTELGLTAHAEIAAEVKAARRRVTEGITAEEYATTVDVLARMAANLTAR